MKKTYFFTLLSLILTSTLTLAAGGDMGTGTDPNTDGSETHPWMIEDLADFDTFADPANAATYWAAGVHTKLMTDIDLSGRTYTTAVIFSANQPFHGNFDGQNHIISNLTVTGSRLCSLFGKVSGSTSELSIIKNIILQKCNIASDAAYNGCLIGWVSGFAIIQNCHIKQSQVTSPYDLIGGLIGLTGTDVMISMCSVTDTDVSGGEVVGGLIGAASLTDIQACYVDCSVQGTVNGLSGDNGLGGLVGVGLDDNDINNCYSTGLVSSVGVNNVGGLVGSFSGSFENCYSTSMVNGTDDVGGLVGSNYGSLTHCFWDVDTSGTTDGVGNEEPDPDGVLGKTTAEMMTQSTFTGWDFSTPVWMMLRPGEDYPRLAWQEVFAGDIAGLYGVDMVDFARLASQWGESVCNDTNNWCQGADIDHADGVDIKDLAVVAEDWLR